MSGIKFVRTKIGNTNDIQSHGSKSFDTEDFVYIDSVEDAKKFEIGWLNFYATDFAIAGGRAAPYRNSRTMVWTRDSYDDSFMKTKNNSAFTDSGYDYLASNFTCAGTCPNLAIDLESLKSETHDFKDLIICPNGYGNGYGEKWTTVEIPALQYPQTRFARKENQTLDELHKQGYLKKTGKTYTFPCEDEGFGELCEVEEYEYFGLIFVKVKACPCLYKESVNEYSDGSKAEDKENLWIRVEPIKWIIKNWDQMPTSINPRGDGNAANIELRSAKVLYSGIPMNTQSSDDSYCHPEISMWQNSMQRAFLNGYDIYEEIKRKGNGNKRYLGEINYSFKGKGFLDEIDHSDLIRRLEIEEGEDYDPFSQLEKDAREK